MRRPFDGDYPVSRAYGLYDPIAYANYPGFKHPGTDYATGYRLPLLAVFSGKLRVIDRGLAKTGRGREVQIHGQYQANYCHLDQITVKDGQTVAEGDLIGYSGWTGYVLPPNVNGSHLHFEILVGGQYADPEKILNEQGEQMTIQEAEAEAYETAISAHMAQAEITQEWLNYHAPRIITEKGYRIALSKLLRSKGTKWDEFNHKGYHYDADIQKAYENGAASVNATVLKPGTYKVN